MKQMLLRQQTSVVGVIAHSPGVIAPHGARLAREEWEKRPPCKRDTTIRNC